MSVNRRLQKASLLSQLLDLEETEVEELDEKYDAEFTSDFFEEIRYLKSVKKEEDTEADEKSFKVPQALLKKLHRGLAMATHPDRNHECDEVFKTVQDAYEKGDVSALLAHANRLRVETDITEEEVGVLENQIVQKQLRLRKRKNTIRWAWCTSDKSEELRAGVLKNLGIDEKAFKIWQEKSSENV